MMDSIKAGLMVGAGGALGTLFRHGINVATLGTSFPLGTVVENWLGSFLLGILAGWVSTRELTSRWVNYVVGVGFCGGFTTMSTFAADSFYLAAEVDRAGALLYVAASVIGGLIFAGLGHGSGHKLARSTTSTKDAL